MPELKLCPFCGGEFVYDKKKTTIASTETTGHCNRCGMYFEYEQSFAFSAKSRVPIDDSFEKIWNSRPGTT